MKSLRESLLDDELVEKTDKLIKDEIKAFLKKNFKGADSCKISEKPNTDGKYEVSSTNDIYTKTAINLNSLTNGMFIWTAVDGDFDCAMCHSLKSLEGAPKEVGGDFYCSMCSALKSLEGAPKEIDGDFYCTKCSSLTSLKYAPEKVEGDFYCSGCTSLKSLEGAPKEVGGKFVCFNCKVQFTKDDVEKISNVKGRIICYL